MHLGRENSSPETRSRGFLPRFRGTVGGKIGEYKDGLLPPGDVGMLRDGPEALPAGPVKNATESGAKALLETRTGHWEFVLATVGGVNGRGSGWGDGRCTCLGTGSEGGHLERIAQIRLEEKRGRHEHARGGDEIAAAQTRAPPGAGAGAVLCIAKGTDGPTR